VRVSGLSKRPDPQLLRREKSPARPGKISGRNLSADLAGRLARASVVHLADRLVLAAGLAAVARRRLADHPGRRLADRPGLVGQASVHSDSYLLLGSPPPNDNKRFDTKFLRSLVGKRTVRVTEERRNEQADRRRG
jgi:hypothetical protein